MADEEGQPPAEQPQEGETPTEATPSQTGEGAATTPSSTDAGAEAGAQATGSAVETPASTTGAEAPPTPAPETPPPAPAAAAAAVPETTPPAVKSDAGMKKRSSTARSKGKGKTVDLENCKIGIIGAGKAAEYLVDAMINFAKIPAKRIHIAAPSTKNTDKFKTLGCSTTKRNIDIFARYDCDVVFLCFHGGVVKYCYKLGGIRPHPITTNYIPNMKHAICILSMVSGVNLEQIKAVLLNPEHPKGYILEIHRVMLNAAVAYGLGICAIDVEPDSSKLSAPIRTLLSSVGRLEYVPESQMDAACAIAGNGLAFGYYFMNAMADGAFKMGLSRNMAIKFAAKTVHCGAQCLLESGRHPSELRDAVTAAGGPAIYGIHVLDKADVASGIQGAVEAAYKRAVELAETEIASSS
jgi:pyrroline-5-carboxylate reductase